MKQAFILINTGSPERLEVEEVRRYLTDFLCDERVLSMPRWIRLPLVKGVIAPLRAPKTREKYATIWQEGGSPLVVYSEALANEVERISGVPTLVAMRYDRGSIECALSRARDLGAEEVVLVPLFPHYAMSSYESAVAYAVAAHEALATPYQLNCVAPYYNHPLYIEALAEQVSRVVAMGTHLLFSYHGIPISHNTPYRGNHEKDYPYQCLETTRLVMAHPWVKALQVSHEVVYQSRFGNGKWLSPLLEERLKALPHEGKKKVAVLCPSFVCDSLESLWEIGVDIVPRWSEMGGDTLTLIPCPNASHTMARAIVDVIEDRATEAKRWIAP